VRVKVVPGSARDVIVGPHGDRIRVKVAAPPEAGRANRALLALLARALGLPPARLAVTSGAASPEKTVTVAGLAAAEVRLRLDGRP
jgi:uncharacterized protein (TIGR00251 family)